MFPSTALDCIVASLRHLRECGNEDYKSIEESLASTELRTQGVVKVGKYIHITDCVNGDVLVVTVEYRKSGS